MKIGHILMFASCMIIVQNAWCIEIDVSIDTPKTTRDFVHSLPLVQSHNKHRNRKTRSAKLLVRMKNYYYQCAGIDNDETFWTIMSAAPTLACILWVSGEYS